MPSSLHAPSVSLPPSPASSASNASALAARRRSSFYMLLSYSLSCCVMVRSMAKSMARSMATSMARSMVRSVAKPMAEPMAKSMVRSMAYYFFNQNMRGYSQNESVLGAPKREVITLNDVPLGNHEPMTVSELFRNKSHDNRLRNAIDDWQTQVCNNQLSPKLNNSRLMYLN